MTKGLGYLGSTLQWGPQSLLYKQIKWQGIKGKFLGLLVRPRLADGILMEAKVKGIRVDRLEIKVY